MSAAAIRKARDAWQRALAARDGKLLDGSSFSKDAVAAAIAEEEAAFSAYIAEAEREDEEEERP